MLRQPEICLIRIVKRAAAAAVISAFSVVLLAGTAHAQRREIVLAQFDWPASIAITYILKQVLEQELDLRATVVPLSQDVGWQNIEKGVLDAAAEIWWPARAADIDRYVHERQTVQMSLTYDNAPQGIIIPTWVSKRYDIHTIDDLRRNAALFDLDGDGRGDMWAGAADWAATEIMQIKVRDYRLDLNAFTDDPWQFYAKFMEAMAQHKPIVFYYWAPDWLFSKYDLTWIEEPPYDPLKWKHVRGAPAQSSITCAWQPAKVYTIFGKSLKERSFKAYQLFSNFQISIAEVNGLIADIENIPDNPRKAPDKVARDWIAGHPEIVQNWLRASE